MDMQIMNEFSENGKNYTNNLIFSENQIILSKDYERLKEKLRTYLKTLQLLTLKVLKMNISNYNSENNNSKTGFNNNNLKNMKKQLLLTKKILSINLKSVGMMQQLHEEKYDLQKFINESHQLKLEQIQEMNNFKDSNMKENSSNNNITSISILVQGNEDDLCFRDWNQTKYSERIQDDFDVSIKTAATVPNFSNHFKRDKKITILFDNSNISFLNSLYLSNVYSKLIRGEKIFLPKIFKEKFASLQMKNDEIPTIPAISEIVTSKCRKIDNCSNLKKKKRKSLQNSKCIKLRECDLTLFRNTSSKTKKTLLSPEMNVIFILAGEMIRIQQQSMEMLILNKFNSEKNNFIKFKMGLNQCTDEKHRTINQSQLDINGGNILMTWGNKMSVPNLNMNDTGKNIEKKEQSQNIKSTSMIKNTILIDTTHVNPKEFQTQIPVIEHHIEKSKTSSFFNITDVKSSEQNSKLEVVDTTKLARFRTKIDIGVGDRSISTRDQNTQIGKHNISKLGLKNSDYDHIINPIPRVKRKEDENDTNHILRRRMKTHDYRHSLRNLQEIIQYCEKETMKIDYTSSKTSHVSKKMREKVDTKAIVLPLIKKEMKEIGQKHNFFPYKMKKGNHASHQIPEMSKKYQIVLQNQNSKEINFEFLANDKLKGQKLQIRNPHHSHQAQKHRHVAAHSNW